MLRVGLVSDGVPVNVVQRLMGHELASTTLNLYVHAPEDCDERVRRLFRDPDEDEGSGAGIGARSADDLLILDAQRPVPEVGTGL